MWNYENRRRPFILNFTCTSWRSIYVYISIQIDRQTVLCCLLCWALVSYFPWTPNRKGQQRNLKFSGMFFFKLVVPFLVTLFLSKRTCFSSSWGFYNLCKHCSFSLSLWNLHLTQGSFGLWNYCDTKSTPSHCFFPGMLLFRKHACEGGHISVMMLQLHGIYVGWKVTEKKKMEVE